MSEEGVPFSDSHKDITGLCHEFLSSIHIYPMRQGSALLVSTTHFTDSLMRLKPWLLVPYQQPSWGSQLCPQRPGSREERAGMGRPGSSCGESPAPPGLTPS